MRRSDILDIKFYDLLSYAGKIYVETIIGYYNKKAIPVVESYRVYIDDDKIITIDWDKKAEKTLMTYFNSEHAIFKKKMSDNEYMSTGDPFLDCEVRDEINKMEEENELKKEIYTYYDFLQKSNAMYLSKKIIDGFTLNTYSFFYALPRSSIINMAEEDERLTIRFEDVILKQLLTHFASSAMCVTK
ncbi:MAG: hypothetical protein K9K79_04175 [Desulfohalobiaceae bacterium]|nr:hypothetical protein [Desulfohalobiaceae bacterium]